MTFVSNDNDTCHYRHWPFLSKLIRRGYVPKGGVNVLWEGHWDVKFPAPTASTLGTALLTFHIF
jgi:hypothetical protein